MNANEKFQRLIIAGGRVSGRTEAMLKGAANTPNCVVVCANRIHEQHIKSRAPNVQTISIEDSGGKLMGLHQPVVFDHFALQLLWEEREREFLEKIEKIKESKK